VRTLDALTVTAVKCAVDRYELLPFELPLQSLLELGVIATPGVSVLQDVFETGLTERATRQELAKWVSCAAERVTASDAC
jgi:hypothetical protein